MENEPLTYDQTTRKEIADQLWRLFGFEAEQVEVHYAHRTIHMTVHLKEPVGDAQGIRTYINDWNVIREDKPSFR